MFIGSGEAGKNHYDLYTHNTGENFYATSDTHIYLQANGQTIANRVGMIITNGHTIVPCKADVTTNNTGSIGTSSARWAGMYAMKYNGLLTGTGTAGQDKGSGTTNRYVPAKWTFNIGSNTVGEGDLFVIKLPVAGHDYGTYLSLNNGTNYYPVIYNTSTRLTSHFPVSSCIIVTFDSAGSAGSIFPLNGGDARTTVSGGAFRVVDFYDSGNSTVNQTATTGNANYEVLFSGTADNTTRNEGTRKSNTLLFNPSTGTLTTKVLTPNKTLADSWINCGKNPNIYINNTNAAPWITGNTKNGRIALCSYVSNDDKLYFNYWTNTTLAGTENKTDKQMTWDASNGTLTTATFSGNLVGNVTGNCSGSSGSCTGNAATATTASALSNFSVSTTSSVGLEISTNVHGYVSGLTKADWNSQQSDGAIYGQFYNTSWKHEIYGDYRTGQIAVRGKNNGTWTDWKSIGMFTTTPTTGQVVITDGTYGGIKSSGYTIAKSVPSNAVFTDVNVKVANTNPSSGTWYYPVWYTATSGSGGLNANDGLRYYCLQGTASTAGRSIIQVGNGTSTGTAGNKYGEIWLYSKTNGSVYLTTSADENKGYSQVFPPVAGIITIMSSSSITSGNVVIADGTSGGVKVSSYTIAKSVPSDAVFTDANVTQTEVSDLSYYEVCLSNSNSGSVKKSSNFKFLPSYGRLEITTSSDSDTNIFSIFYTKDGSSNHLGFNVYGEGSCSCATLSTKDRVYAGEGIELGTASASTVPFIDFHWNSTDTDYTARLIQRAENTIDFMGKNSSTWGTARAASFSSQSSIYVKENISNITDEAAKRILQLRPVNFDYKGDGNKNQRGLIAEEVMDVMPEMVIIPQGYTEYDPIEPWNTPCIDYSKFVPYLIKMVQIQQKEIDELKFKAKD